MVILPRQESARETNQWSTQGGRAWAGFIDTVNVEPVSGHSRDGRPCETENPLGNESAKQARRLLLQVLFSTERYLGRAGIGPVPLQIDARFKKPLRLSRNFY